MEQRVISPTVTVEDDNLERSLRPKVLAEYIGQIGRASCRETV